MAGNGQFLRVGTLDELKARGMIVVTGARPILVCFHDGKIRALDNRCPHLGFPLHRGSVKDGVLTCHWHHARFDLASGCTFDLWADDVPSAVVELRGNEVWVANDCHFADEKTHWQNRLREGMEQSISLIIGKAVLGSLGAGCDPCELVREAALFGARHRDGWASGMTIHTAMGNLLSSLPDEERYLALLAGISRVAADCVGQPPRRNRHALDGGHVPLDQLKRWMRDWTLVRHRDGAERTLLTAIAQGATQPELTNFLAAAATDRFYADGGHALDFINKAFECLDLVGWKHAAEILPTVVRQLVAARGGEEMNAWRSPQDLVLLLNDAFRELPSLLAGRVARKSSVTDHQFPVSNLAKEILGDDPGQIVAALKSAIVSGAHPADLSRALAYASALRITRFGSANEFGDWITALHTFTYCNALHQLFKRLYPNAESPILDPTPLRGVFHGAMSVYLDRFLNVPPARLPADNGESLDDLPSDANELLKQFLAALDSQQQINSAARLVARYLKLGHAPDPLIATLTRAVLREDADFHTFQMLEAGVQQYREWGNNAEGQHILIAVARYLAAHSPTQRAGYQTATIALRLHRGQKIYEE